MTAAQDQSKLRVAVIGMGHRAAGMCRLMGQLDPGFEVVAVADTAPAEAISARLRERGVPHAANLKHFPDADALLGHADSFDGLIIGTPCHLHAPIAVRAAAANLPLFLEKPVALNWRQLDELREAFAGRGDRVVVSFPLRLTAHVQMAAHWIRAGRLGVVNQVQAVNNVPYGGVYYGQWYRDYELTGGLWLQKATHDFDYITYLLSSLPLCVTAMHSRLVYGGGEPAALVCSKCDKVETCPEGPPNLLRRGDDGGTLNFASPSPQSDHACCFSESIKHQDCGSAIAMYESGAHAAYSQNFISRRSAGVRGATVIGYAATLQFTWQSDSIRVIDHHREHVEQIAVRSGAGHGGGDEQLALNFIQVMRDSGPSRVPLTTGLLSAAMCLAARESANCGVAQPVRHPGTKPPLRSKPRINGTDEIEPTPL